MLRVRQGRGGGEFCIEQPNEIMAVIMSDSDSEDDVPLAARLPTTAATSAPSPAAEAKAEPASEIKADPDSDSEPDYTPSPKPKAPKAKDTKPNVKAKAKAKAGATAKPKGILKVKGEGKVAKKATKSKRKFELPGQTRDTPDETDPVRKFYDSLHAQKPESKMARRWKLQHGLFPKEIAEKEFAKVQREKEIAKANKK